MTEYAGAPDGKLNTFWARVKLAFSKDENGEIRPEIAHIPIVVFCGSLVGLMIGGRHGARIRGVSTISSNKLTVYTSSTEAERHYFSAVLLGYMQYGCRWGWRTGLYSGIYSTTLTAMSIGRDKDDAMNYVAAGAATGMVYKIFSGFRSAIVGAVLGGAICAPIGLCMQVLGQFVPYERVLKETREREKASKMERLQATERILEGMETELEDFKNIIG